MKSRFCFKIFTLIQLFRGVSNRIWNMSENLLCANKQREFAGNQYQSDRAEGFPSIVESVSAILFPYIHKTLVHCNVFVAESTVDIILYSNST